MEGEIARGSTPNPRCDRDIRIGRGVGAIVSDPVLALHSYVGFADMPTVSSLTSPRYLPNNIAPVGVVCELPQEVRTALLHAV